MVVRELVALFGVKTDEQSIKKADRASEGLGKRLGGIAKKAAMIGAAISGAAAVGGYKLIGLASDATENLNVIDVAFRKNKEEVLKWSREFSKGAGRSKYELQEMAGALGALLTPMMEDSADISAKMSTRLSELAVNIGSLYNTADSDVLAALRSGLTGEIEPLKRFAISMTEAELKAHALRKGIEKSVKDMTIAEKTALRYSYILDRSSISHGDAIKTSEEYANQVKRLKGQIRDFATDLGKKLLPYATKFVKKLTSWIEKSGGAEAITKEVVLTVKNLGETFKEIGSRLEALLPLFAGIGAAILAYEIKTKAAAAAQWLLNAAQMASPINWVLVGIAAIIAIIVFLIQNWDAVKEVAIGTWNSIVETFSEAAGWFKNNVIDPIVDFFSMLWSDISDGFSALWNGITEGFTSLWDGITEGFSNAWKFIKNWASKIFDVVTAPYRKIGSFISDIFSGSEENPGKRGARPTTAGPGIGASRGGVVASTSNNVNVEVKAAAGMDERRLAGEVARQVGSEMKKQNRAAMRSLVPVAAR